jgi:hypothetical protein
VNLNQYTDKIIKILKETVADGQNTIWEIFISDQEIKNTGMLSKAHIELLDTIFMSSIKKMKQEDVIELWKYTDDCYIHESSHVITGISEYDGNITSDIKNELIELLLCDIRMLH